MCEIESSRKWQQERRYTDHLGYPVVLEQRVDPDWEPEGMYMAPIQVYSLFPLDEDHTSLRNYLLGYYQDNSEDLPLFEIYLYLPPNTYACISHNRREIAHRKQQHRVGAPNRPPLIPQFLNEAYEHPMGFCILLCFNSYRFGYEHDEGKYTEVGEGSNRKSSALDPSYEGSYLEAFELSIEHVEKQGFVHQIVNDDMFDRAAEMGLETESLEYAIDVDEGEPSSSPSLSKEQKHLHLHQQATARSYELGDAFRVSRDSSIVTITNTSDGAEPDIQYPIYASFLSRLPDTVASDILETTARLFTAALVSHLLTSKTVTLKFCIPDSNSWFAILPAHTRLFSKHSRDLPTGAIQRFFKNLWDGESIATWRVSPQRREDSIHTARSQLRAPYRAFAAVLNRPNFVNEAGVYFFMADNR
ncbi:hypothetical protein BDV06DRAFT_224784 [Aspergillus oleicola]